MDNGGGDDGADQFVGCNGLRSVGVIARLIMADDG